MIGLIGDIAFSGIISDYPQDNEERYKEIIPILSKFDLVIANLEVPIRFDKSKNEYKNFIHYSLLEPTKDLLKNFNIGCVSLANNHIYDCKMPGLRATIKALDELGIKHTGAGWLKEHIDPVIIELNNIRIAVLAYVDKSTNPKTENFDELFINYFEVQTVISDIQNLKDRADQIIVNIHWGDDYSYYPTPKQIVQARLLADAGADIIMGHHPHTFQPFERYKDSLIFYSLGGLTFGDYEKNGKIQALFRKTKHSAIVSFDYHANTIKFISTRELKNNYVIITKKNYFIWSKIIWFFFKTKYSHQVFEALFNFHEKVIYRIYEYFFGYHQNPIRRLFQLSNVVKIKRLFIELKQ
jgi:poly-gamma-glutamate capsule biosynthesis protein CapA/YwtB (metallophosphatase superfamily)